MKRVVIRDNVIRFARSGSSWCGNLSLAKISRSSGKTTRRNSGGGDMVT